MGLSSEKIIGTLVPISSLRSDKQSPQNYGTFETGWYFLDWLKKTNQSAWQVLPLHETQFEKDSRTKHVPSPYKGYGVGLDPKYLSSGERRKAKDKKEIEKFVSGNKDWLSDYAFFCALRDHYGTDDWREWDKGLKTRDSETLDLWSEKLNDKIDTHIYTQFQLHREYKKLRKKAKKLGVYLIGDLPFYLSIKSPLVWANQEVFQIEKDGSVNHVSGVPNNPPSFFGRQVWGHVLYNWQKNNLKNALKLWELRISYMAQLFDLVRLDYIKAIFEYGAMDLRDEKNDNYEKGPGAKFFEELIKYCQTNKLSVFAEDTGNKLEELREALGRLKVPGIKMFRFAYNEQKKRIETQYADWKNYPSLTISYTTTQDTETLVGYLQKLNSRQKKELCDASRILYSKNNKKLAYRIRSSLIKSPAQIVIIPIQDWLLTTDRINTPGTEKEKNDPNWQYKLKTPIEELPLEF